MAKTRRNSIENMFAKKGSVQPQKKEVVEEPIIPEPIEVDDKVEDIQEEIVNTDNIEEVVEEKIVIQEEAKETIKEVIPQKNEPKENISSSIDSLFNKKKKVKGKQQSVYFRKDVYDFCNDIAERYELGISDVVNKLILSIMEDVE